MKRNTSGVRKFLLLGVLGFGLLTGCTDDFEELNVDQTKLTTLGEDEYPFLFSKAQTASSYDKGGYQIAQNLFADLYAQYYATVATYFPSDRNVIRMDWLSGHWLPIYTATVPQLKVLMENYEPDSPEYAMASVTWVFAFHRLTDYYGPVPYFQAGEPLESVPYDAQEDIYNDFFQRLDAAAAVFRANAGENAFGSFDLIYGGELDKWLLFTNSLRLRLALRISDVAPERARAEAEAAVAGGVLEDPADDAYMFKSNIGNDQNGLSAISVWNEFRMSASMESVLKGYDDPRIGEFFQPVAETGTYEGVRNGLSPTQLGESVNLAQNNSNVGSRWAVGGGSLWQPVGETKQNILHSAETYFNRAEGALNGWNMGDDAETLYNAGIRSSMIQWGIADEAAIAAYQASGATPTAPGDFLNSPPVFDTPIAWGDSEDLQREQIATQKWLALFPDGLEAWANLRRTDLPDLYPVVNSENTLLPDGARPNRIPFLDGDRATNAEAVDAAVSLLKGPDNVVTRLWWDVD